MRMLITKKEGKGNYNAEKWLHLEDLNDTIIKLTETIRKMSGTTQEKALAINGLIKLMKLIDKVADTKPPEFLEDKENE